MSAVAQTTNRQPKVVAQPGALFLMTPEGEIWRVQDTDHHGTTRNLPAANLGVPARLFTATTTGLTLIHRFVSQSKRALDAAALLEQLDMTATC
jgi:hypothetical protein